MTEPSDPSRDPSGPVADPRLDVTRRASDFGTTGEGRPVRRYELRAADGTGLAVHELGARWDRWWLPDGSGEVANVLQAPADVAGVEADRHFMGATVGRYANRLREGRFVIDGVEHRVPPNEGTTALHGGPEGFHAQLWQGRFVEVGGRPAVRLTRTSPDGEMGFPGTLEVRVEYVLLESGGVRIVTQATTDAATVVSLTNHAYLNLAGRGDVREHRLQVAASRYTPVDGDLLPTGEVREVAGTPLDLRDGRRVGDVAEEPGLDGGLDHNYVVDPPDPATDGEGHPVARLSHPASGRAVTVLSTLPGLQVYTGQGLPTKGGTFPAYAGLCLETQQFPDAPNQPGFPSPVLRPGQVWRSVATLLPTRP